MRVAILTIPSQQHRVWALLGHLQTIGFPVIRNRDLIKVYRGYNHTDYKNRYEVVKAMADDGFPQYRRLLERSNHDNLKKIRSFSDCCTWGMLSILRKVVEGEEPVLVLENDAFFKDISYFGLEGAIQDLIDAVGYENVNLAICSIHYAKKPDLRANADTEDVDGFWVKGASGYSQTANIFTPHGAQFFLDTLPPCYPNIENYVYHGNKRDGSYERVEGVYSTKEDIVDPHFFCNFDSFRTGYRDPDHWRRLVKGEPL